MITTNVDVADGLTNGTWVQSQMCIDQTTER